MRASAAAKINLALVVGPRREDGKHELVTVYQRLGMADRIDVIPAAELHVDGFPGDTLVRGALEALAVRAGVEPRWHATIEKRLPVAAGLGGGVIKMASDPDLRERLGEQYVKRNRRIDGHEQLRRPDLARISKRLEAVRRACEPSWLRGSRAVRLAEAVPGHIEGQRGIAVAGDRVARGIERSRILQGDERGDVRWWVDAVCQRDR